MTAKAVTIVARGESTAAPCAPADNDFRRAAVRSASVPKQVSTKLCVTYPNRNRVETHGRREGRASSRNDTSFIHFRRRLPRGSTDRLDIGNTQKRKEEIGITVRVFKTESGAAGSPRSVSSLLLYQFRRCREGECMEKYCRCSMSAWPPSTVRRVESSLLLPRAPHFHG